MNNDLNNYYDFGLATNWRIHFPRHLCSPDIAQLAIKALLSTLSDFTTIRLPHVSNFAVGFSPTDTLEEDGTPTLWINYSCSPALLAHECNKRHLCALMRHFWQLTGVSKFVIRGSDGNWLIDFDPAPNGNYYLMMYWGKNA